MITKQAFGRSRHLSSRILHGTATFSEITQAETEAALELVLYLGVNHIDVTASYCEAELRSGNWVIWFTLLMKCKQLSAPCGVG
jgi:aryl-alcohol dehydrogenase-like predicted oxidoreductase